LAEDARIRKQGESCEVADQFAATDRFSAKLLQSRYGFSPPQYSKRGAPMSSGKLALPGAACSYHKPSLARYDFNPL
jgi:hypothetical protein